MVADPIDTQSRNDKGCRIYLLDELTQLLTKDERLVLEGNLLKNKVTEISLKRCSKDSVETT